MSDLYEVIEPHVPKIPIIVSVPHSGLEFPKELRSLYKPSLAKCPDDTDFFVDRLYDFVTDMGITMIRANYSRWVIDLNRSPENQALYQDGRIITDLTPTTDFVGNSIYKSPELQPDETEVKRRKELYFYPYYQKLSELLEARKAAFGKVLLWDAHSIRRVVSTIQPTPFPDLILGDNKGLTANSQLINTTLQQLSKSSYTLFHNTPFQGGNITRSFGNPAHGVHALQLEMCKTLYMDDMELHYDETRANRVRVLLQRNFEALKLVLARL